MNDYKKIYQDGQISVETLPSVFINISLLISVSFLLILYKLYDILFIPLPEFRNIKVFHFEIRQKEGHNTLVAMKQNFSFAWLLAG